MHVEFMWWEDCPSHPKAWQRLQQALADLEVEATVERIEVNTDADADELRFPGSPTIRVNGADIDPQASEMPSRLTCRLYRTETGRPSPLPSLAMIKRAIIKAQSAD